MNSTAGPSNTVTSWRLAAILAGSILVCVVVLIEASHLHPEYRFAFKYDTLWPALIILVTIGFGIWLSVSEFSFGYVLTYYFFIMIVGFLWINQFSTLDYDHALAAAAAVASLIAFAAPSLLVGRPLKSGLLLSLRTTEFVLFFTIMLCVIVILLGMRFRVHLPDAVTYADLREELLRTAKMRSSVELPAFLRYSVALVSSAILPFAFACFVERRQYWLAAMILLMLACFFPITLTKTSLLSPLWLAFVAIVASAFEARTASILTLLAPMAFGLFALQVPGQFFGDVFNVLSFRMVVIPSAALSFYNEFFSHHPTTFFCQIGIVKSVIGCPYMNQLGVLLSATYGLGNYNASLFATEGVASVGALFSPMPAFVCGLVIGCANRISAGLPSRFILVSSAITTVAFLNVPFSTTLVTHGAALLFLMWYLIPREFLNPSKEAG